MKKMFAVLSMLLVAALCFSLCACGRVANNTQTEETTRNTQESHAPTETTSVVPEKTTAAPEETTAVSEETTAATEDTTPATEDTTPTEPEETEPVISVKDPVDITTTGGAVIVGTVGFDEAGWHIVPEQPLNIAYEYFLDNPSVFPEQTRIRLVDPRDDGMDKAIYLGHTVTVHGTFRFVRNDFETLYLAPYTITMGKIVEESYGDSEIRPPEGPVDLYDRSEPLPKYLEPMIVDGKYIFNAFMLSEESLQLLGNDFAVFFCDFVDAFLNYRSEVPCPQREYAEMLGTVIYYDFPLFNACAQPFEYLKHYDDASGTINIVYQFSEDEHLQLVDRFLAAADEMLATVTPEMSDVEKAKNIYHELCTRMDYDDSALEDLDRKDSYYAYLHNSGVCVTFANVYNQLLTQVGLKTTLATCEYDATMGHVWSVVTLDGEDYFCDPTFELNYDSGNGYRYFGMNYADRISDGTGIEGIRGGKYFTYSIQPDMMAGESLDP